MLYPQNNLFRQFIDLSGLWEFRFDRCNEGVEQGWAHGFVETRPIAVPASWNDQFEDGRDFLGPGWYQTRFHLPWVYNFKRLFLRFDSVNYLARVWLNGQELGNHEGGHLPFQFEITDKVFPTENLLVVQVDGNLSFDRVPPGNITGDTDDFFDSHSSNYPQTNFDFFPFCGIQRPVLLYAVPECALQDLTVNTEIKGTTGIVRVEVQTQNCDYANLFLTLKGQGKEFSATSNRVAQATTIELTIPDAAFWEPSSPNLYQLTVQLLFKGELVDLYTLPIGIRTIKVEGNQLLLNEKPIYLQGFCRHEDFPITGRGYQPAVLVKDLALMKWACANSFRTTHYPYSEQTMDLADRLGFLVIDETPAVGLFFRTDGLQRRLDLCRQYVQELISRDKNHPSVIMWSLANEPLSLRKEAKPFFNSLYCLAKSLDPSRPVTIVSSVGIAEESLEFLDVACLNRYYGWYMNSGRIEEGVQNLSIELDMLYEHFHKPIILTEFGADTIPGVHAQPPEMFSEEYQAEFLTRYIELLRSKPYVIGEHVWVMCDFKTAQGTLRMGGYNYKGVFTRDRRPKMAAHTLRKLWNSTSA
jgi:beta-glucuronidase